MGRNDYLDFLIKLKDKKVIKAVTGVKGCGKSTLFILYKKYLLENGVKDEQIISLNFENTSDISNWKELYNYINDKIISSEMYYVFLDEVEILNQFEKLINGLFLNKNIDLYVTFSNSKMIPIKLTGRYIEIHMLPLSFSEFLEYYGKENELKKYNTYIENGGFPYLLNLDNNSDLIRNYLDGIYNTILLKDVVSRNNVKDTLILESIVKFLFDNIGQIVSTNKISATLNSNNRKNSVNTIENYLSYLLDSYLIYKVSRYDIRGKEYLKTGDKYYVCDLGLRNYLLGGIKDLDSILENVIFLELKRKGYQIYIGKYDDLEVDFVLKNNDGLKYVQVALSVRDEKTLKREINVLQKIKDNYPKYLITLDYDKVDYEGIRQIPALEFLTGEIKL